MEKALPAGTASDKCGAGFMTLLVATGTEKKKAVMQGWKWVT